MRLKPWTRALTTSKTTNIGPKKMDTITELLAQAPLVAALVYVGWLKHKQDQAEMARLRERVLQKDTQLGEFAKVFDKLSFTLELIKDRLR